ncbi:MAG: hypothetical protein KIT84_42905 [Labilithrix sp.]|nr:hypothetical protein [Labilithrix sp.]MCW5817829.1 hypothetical protein [Labilithrix sp.]
MAGVNETGWILLKRGTFLALVAGLACSSDPTPPPPPPPDAGPAGEDAAAPDAGDAEATCQDDDGFLPSCDGIDGLAERQCDRATCERYLRRMKTRIARRAIACLRRHIPAGDSCRPCAGEALATSCDDPIAVGACEQLAETCPTRSVEECAVLMAGLSFGGRLNFVACTTEQSCLHDMPSCLP